jgi:hypothetical protein
LESIKEVIIWQVGNVEIADIRSKRIPPLKSVRPAKKNANSLTTPVIPRTANLKALTNEYDFKGGFKWPRITAVKSQENYLVPGESLSVESIKFFAAQLRNIEIAKPFY